MLSVISNLTQLKNLCVTASDVVVTLRKVASHNLCQKYEDRMARAVKSYQEAESELMSSLLDDELGTALQTMTHRLHRLNGLCQYSLKSTMSKSYFDTLEHTKKRIIFIRKRNTVFYHYKRQ